MMNIFTFSVYIMTEIMSDKVLSHLNLGGTIAYLTVPYLNISASLDFKVQCDLSLHRTSPFSEYLL